MQAAEVSRYQSAVCYGTIVIPVLNEAGQIGDCLAALQALRAQGWKVVVVDGGSHDDTVTLVEKSAEKSAEPSADEVVQALPGRANQMNAGARLSEGEVLVFLHVDTRLPATFAADMAIFVMSDAQWGRFDVSFTNAHWPFRMISRFMNERSRLTSVATGDQVLFFRRDFFRQIGGFPLIPLMEDIAISKAARTLSLPICIKSRVVTSSRRWEQKGIIRTVLLMWGMRLAYFFGVSPQRLHAWYYRR